MPIRQLLELLVRGGFIKSWEMIDEKKFVITFN
jgi:ribosomal protein S8